MSAGFFITRCEPKKPDIEIMAVGKIGYEGPGDAWLLNLLEKKLKLIVNVYRYKGNLSDEIKSLSIKYHAMKWAFGIRRKISAALLLSAIFVLLFVKNMVESNHVTQLGHSFSSVYEDRLMVESYIYKLSEHLFRKKIMIDTCENRLTAGIIKPLIEGHSRAIETIIADYEKTKLTEAETKYFTLFKENIEKLVLLEKEFLESTAPERLSSAKARIDEQFNEASGNLGHLSGIQVSEGKILTDNSKKIVAGSSLLTQFEIGILIAIGLMILVLVFESSAVFPGSAREQSLN